MDEASTARLDDARDDLLAWGVIERGGGDHALVWTRRFRAAVMREAARLAGEERAGERHEGSPLAVATASALASLDAAASRATMTHARLAAAIEAATLPGGVRELLQ